MRLSTRIAVGVGVVVPLLVLASGLLLLRLAGRDTRAALDARLEQRAAAIAPVARTLLRADRDGRPVVTATRERRLFAAALDLGVRVVTGPADTPVAEGGPQPVDTVPLPAASTTPVTVAADGHTWRAVRRSLSGASKAGAGGEPGDALWVFAPGSAQDAGLTAVRRRIVLIALVAAPVSALLALAVAERATRPLRRLRRAAAGLDPRASAVRLEETRSGVTEVDELAGTLRTLLARYDEQAARTGEALETARSFSAAASHELRTPLMSMRTNLDILAAHPDLDPAERTEVVADLRAEHARLQGLVVTLRALAQGDLVEADAFTPVDLGEVVEAAASEAAGRRPDARIAVDAGSVPPIPGWEPGLRLVVDNLLANALRHGHPPGSAGSPVVEVTLSVRDAEAVLTVDDHGPGIPPSAREEVFQRFRRGADSPGTGLGLTLVAQQVALHRGLVLVADRPDGRSGARFEVRLPLGPTDPATVELPRHRDWLTGSVARRRS